MAQMFPEHPLAETKSNAEGKVFYALKDLLPSEYTVLHSVPVYRKMKRDDRLLDGELDFLLLHPEKGMIVIEVKGGGIELENKTGKWFSISFDGSKHTIKDPYEQGKD